MALLGIGAVASLSLAAWFAALDVSAWVGCLVVLPVVPIISMWRTLRPYHLKWDGRAWHLAEADRAGLPQASVREGRVAVAIDLSGWLLLRWWPQAPESGRSVWLPVQRGGLEPQWHALRSAVHATPIGERADAAADH